jgi:hypothetical protein
MYKPLQTYMLSKRTYTRLIKALVLACGTYRRKIVALGRQCSEALFETWETSDIMAPAAYRTGNTLAAREKIQALSLPQTHSNSFQLAFQARLPTA